MEQNNGSSKQFPSLSSDLLIDASKKVQDQPHSFSQLLWRRKVLYLDLL